MQQTLNLLRSNCSDICVCFPLSAAVQQQIWKSHVTHAIATHTATLLQLWLQYGTSKWVTHTAAMHTATRQLKLRSTSTAHDLTAPMKVKEEVIMMQVCVPCVARVGRVLQGVVGCCKVLQDVARCYVLQRCVREGTRKRVSSCCRVLHYVLRTQAREDQLSLQAFLYMWCDSFIRVTWLMHTHDITHANMWQDASICVTWLLHMCGRTHLRVWFDSFMCGMSHSYIWLDSFIYRWNFLARCLECWASSFTCGTLMSRIWYRYVTCLWNMIRAYLRCDCYLCDTWLGFVRDCHASHLI